mgnify:CR=1 FL=1
MNERFIEEVLSLLPKGSSSFPKEAITIALKTALDGKKVYVDRSEEGSKQRRGDGAVFGFKVVRGMLQSHLEIL